LKIEKGNRIPSSKWEEITKQPEFVEKLCVYIKDDFDNLETMSLMTNRLVQ
jgi:hypothetical protein